MDYLLTKPDLFANLDSSDSQPSLRDCSWLSCTTQDYILGYYQPSLAGLFLALVYPGLASWATLSQRCPN